AALVTPPFAGCGESPSTTTTETPTPTETETETETESPTPTPTPPDGFATLVPREGCEPIALPESPTYPPFDGATTADAARDFAAGFERALVDAHLRAEARTEGRRVETNDVDREAATVREAGAGYVVRVHLTGAAVVREGTTPANRTHTPIPSVPYDVRASYYLTERYAIRQGRESEVGALPEGVVACG
ncbi:MAG: hypothetical protein ABEH47_01990, partial [Haloferacaceae archaeon]